LEQHENEPLSLWRVVEVTLAFAMLIGIAGCWAYGWLRGTGLLAGLWYGG
jgi:hypothetical protein